MAFSLFTYSTNRVSTSPLFEDYIFFFFSHSRKRTVAFRRGVKARESSARCGGSFALVLADFATDVGKLIWIDGGISKKFLFLFLFFFMFVLSKGDERVGRIDSVTKFPFTTE